MILDLLRLYLPPQHLLACTSARDARKMRRVIDCSRDSLGNPLVEHGGHDVLGMEFIWTDGAGNRMGGGELHLFVDT